MTTLSYRTQEIIIRSVLPRISGSLSILGSSAIIVSMLMYGRKKKLRYSFNRLLFMMCCFDIFSSFGHVWATSALPKDYGYYAHDAAGNLTTCRIQGFLLLLGMAVPIYFYFLTVHYLLVIRYGMKEQRIRRTFEPFMHLFALTFAIGAAVCGLILGDGGCWAAQNPQDCFNDDGNNENCAYGENAAIYAWIFGGIPSVLPLFLVPFTMGFIFWTVRKQTLKMNKYSPNTLFRESATRTASRDSVLVSQSTTRDNTVSRESTTSAILRPFTLGQSTTRDNGSSDLNSLPIANLRRKIKCKTTERLKAVAHQGLAYSLCYMFVFVWPIIFYIFVLYSENYVPPLFVSVLFYLCYPLQGFLSYIVYVRPFAIQKRKAHPEWSILRAVYVVTFPRRPGGRNSISICQELSCCKLDRDENKITEVSETDFQSKNKVDLDRDDGVKDCDQLDPEEKEEVEDNDQSDTMQRCAEDDVERDLVEALARAASHRNKSNEGFNDTEQEIKEESEYFEAIMELSKITGNYS